MKKNRNVNDNLSESYGKEYEDKVSSIPNSKYSSVSQKRNLSIPPLSNTSPSSSNAVSNNKLISNDQINSIITKEKKNYYGPFLLTAVILLITEQYLSYICLFEYPKLSKSKQHISHITLFHYR